MSDSGAEVSKKPFWKRKGCLFGALGGLALLAVLCLTAAIMLQSSRNPAISRSKQKQAMSEVRALAVTIQSYQTDFNTSPVPPGVHPGSGWTFVPVSTLAPLLSPAYIQVLPERDPWGQPYLYGLTGEHPQWFCVVSTGKDRARDSEGLPEAPSATHCWESDIIWMNGEFLRYPAGKQRRCGKGDQ